MADDTLFFNNIVLGGRLRINPGRMRVHSGGIEWKRQGGKEIKVHESDIVGLTWMKVTKSFQLGVQTKDGQLHKFTGFHDQDFSNLTNFLQGNFGRTLEVKELSVSGHNWGEVNMSGNVLSFLVGSKHAFDLCLADVSQAQLQGKEDVAFEFHADDTIGADEKDSLIELSFHIPTSNTQYAGDEARSSAQVFHDKVVSIADVGASGEAAVVTFEGIKILTPRAKYDVDLHRSFFRLQGQSNDFKIKYRSIVRLFLLPKDPHTFLVISLDPPIRKGQTLYPHVLLQFDNDSVIDKTLSMSEDLLRAKYKLEASYKGLIHEVFTVILRRLSGVKVTRPGNFLSREKGFAVKSSLRTDDGVLFPLEKEFLFLPKPTLILNDEIAYVEFESHGAAGASMQYFDLVLKLKTEQEYIFQNIQKREYNNLVTFINGKGLKIMNYGDAQNSNGLVNAVRNGRDDTVDPHFERIRDEVDDSDEDDGDFVMEKDDDDGGSPTDESGEDDVPSASESEEEVKTAKKEPKIEEAFTSKMSISRKRSKDEGGSKTVKKEPRSEGGSKTVKKEPRSEGGSKIVKKEPRSEGGSKTVKKVPRIEEDFTSKLSISRKRSNDEDGSKNRKDADGSKKRKPKKKKDPNAPKKALSDFMFFSQMERANIKQSNPGMGFTDVAKALGEKWRNMTGEEKEPFKTMARADQMRYKDAMAGYEGDSMGVDS
ncbi:hypothetical protein ACHQM5_006124 [Ranunculus cassubicifolius]